MTETADPPDSSNPSNMATPDHPPDLAAHVRRLRGLARSLVSSAADAEDAVQDAMLRAVERPPNAPGRLGAWLSAVLRNRVRSVRLEDQRRRQRERSAARGEAVPDGAARFALCKQVVAAVDRLGATDRTVVTMRYFDDLPPREIGRRLTLPVNTVRTRLRRALHKLRQDLDRVHGGDRSAWSVGLLSFAYPGGAVPPAAAASPAGWNGVAQGVTVMQSKAKIVAIATALVGLTAALSWSLLGDGEPSPSAVERRALAGDRPRESQPELPGAAAQPGAPAGGVARSAVVGGDWQVRGIAVRHDGSPASGVRLGVTLFAGLSARGEPLHDGVVRADEAGAFVWTAPAPEQTAVLAFTAAADGWVCSERRWVLPGGRAPMSEIVVRVFEFDAAIDGRVTNEDGKPVAGARVQVGDALTVTMWDGALATSDADGLFSIRTSSRGGLTSLVVTADGYAPFAGRLPAPRGGQAARRDVVLQRGSSVHGTVSDLRGQPIQGARVRARHAEAVTDADGRYVLTCLDQNKQSDVVSVRHETHYAYGRRIVIDRPDQQLDFEMSPLRAVRGRVRSPSGEAVEGAFVFVGEDSLEAGRPDAISEANGSFALTNIGPWHEDFVVQAAGYGMAVADIGIDWEAAEKAPAGQREPIDVVLSPGRQVSGLVTDESGRPLQGVNLHGWLSRHTASGRYLGVVAHTCSDGKFEWAGLPPTSVALEFKKAGYRNAERSDLSDDRIALQVQMAKVVGVAATVVDGEDGAPIPRFTIRLVRAPLAPGQRRAGGYAMAWAYGLDFQDENGEWSTGDEHLGENCHVGVEASAPGYARSDPVVLATRLDPDPRHTVLRLWRGSTLGGRVTERGTGQPVAGALVCLFGSGDRVHGLYESRGPEGLIRRVRTDDAGAFAFDHVQGSVTLAVRHDSHAPHVDGPFDVPRSGPVVERGVELHRGATVRGRVLGPDGNPRHGVAVALAPQGVLGADIRRARTDARGRFSWDRLLPGRYSLRTYGAGGWDGWSPLRREIELAPNDDRTVDLGERAGEAVLRVTVRLAGSEPAEVQVHRAEPGALVRTQRGEGSAFEFSGLRAGVHVVVVSRGSVRRERRIDVAAGATDLVIE